MGPDFTAFTAVLIIIWLTFAAVCIGLTVWGSKFAYNHGKNSGNITVSIVLIACGIFVGLTLIPGIFHLIGTTKAPKSTFGFGITDKEHITCIKVRCPNCKQLADETSVYCHGCGKKIN